MQPDILNGDGVWVVYDNVPLKRASKLAVQGDGASYRAWEIM